mmetsp:Transcript_12280/g.26206  ORF Transcript_12280/g.26206 Transcript_12280/m.26206 type:complete len:765 (-) Transcript_12280:235-2529(-)
MGCCQSTQEETPRSSSGPGRRSSNEVNKNLTQSEINKRVDSIEKSRTAKLGGVTVRYAYLSQRGYYPEDAHKPNQDSFVICDNFADSSSDAFFAVFDGHGRDGDKCAQFAKDNLPGLLSKSVNIARGKIFLGDLSEGRESENGGNDEKKVESELTKEQTQEAILKSHVEVNRRMHLCQDLDDSLSGTTSISMYLHGNVNRITVSNVGDSRAIIGRCADGSADNSEKKEGGKGMCSGEALKAFALSRDQTPYRRDERIRIKKTGARILSLDQIEGLEPVGDDDEEDFAEGENADGEMILGEEIDEGGDPPRVWSPHGEYPGTAFTRSIGDAIAEDLGVFAEPEMLTRELSPEDKIIVLASDGVFEFLTNQSVIDICAKFNDPLEACRAVVAESYELWLQYELRTDDITMICIFIDDVDSSKAMKTSLLRDGSVPLLENNPSEDIREVEDELVTVESRPVRKNISLEKSRALQKLKQKSIRDVTMFIEEDFDVESLYSEKTDEEKSRIAEAIKASVMFQNITDAQRELIYGVMEPMPVKKGAWIIKQGTVGDRFYIVDDGRFEVRILGENQEDPDNTGGNVVHVYTGSRESHSHPSFGELALMYSAPRAASIIAQTDGQLWALHRYAFKKVLAEQGARKDAEKVLKKLDAFKSFDSQELKDLSSYLEESKYAAGDVIIKQGEPGLSLFVILPGGTCESERQGEDGEIIKSILKGHDFFGEELLDGDSDMSYLSTVTATSKVTCWMLQKSDAKRFISSKKKQDVVTP